MLMLNEVTLDCLQLESGEKKKSQHFVDEIINSGIRLL